MKKSVAVLGLLSAAVALSAIRGFAEDKKSPVMDTEIIFVKGHSCSDLPADVAGHSQGCDQVTIRNQSYAKVKMGYAPLERQAMQDQELSLQHGG